MISVNENILNTADNMFRITAQNMDALYGAA